MDLPRQLHLFSFLRHEFLLSPLLLLVSSLAGLHSAVFGLVAVLRHVTRLLSLLGNGSWKQMEMMV